MLTPARPHRLLNKALRLIDARLVRASTSGLLDARREQCFLHGRPSGPPRLRFHLPEFEVTEEDTRLAERVVAAFTRAREHEASLPQSKCPGSDLWEKIAEDHQTEFLSLLVSQDVPAVARVLVNALHHRASYGLNTDSERISFELACSRDDAPILATTIADRFIALAEALAVLYVENPEWGRWGLNIYEDLGVVYDRVERALGFSLSIPECFGLYGVLAGKRVIHPMMAMHAYDCWRMFEVLNGVISPSICEIGGGYGGCAYYASQQPIDRYTIIDLPLINAFQGFFLAKTCGASRVRLYGETNENGPLEVLPYWSMFEIPNKTFDLVLNQESLPEIDHKQATAYIAEIARTSRRWFLSINQESQASDGTGTFRHGVVAEMVAKHGGYRCRRRHPFWLRKANVEELYEIVGP